MDAAFTLALSVLLMICAALTYHIKERKLYFIPDSDGTIFVGMSASAVTEKENIGVLLCSVVGFV